GLIRMDEKAVEIQVVKDDFGVARATYEEATREYIKIMKEQTGKEVTVEVKLDETEFLPASVVGGVVVRARKGKIVLDNTLQSRLKVASATLMPTLRFALFIFFLFQISYTNYCVRISFPTYLAFVIHHMHHTYTGFFFLFCTEAACLE
ncbi:vacuolar ATP synthase subunit E, partial [Reticulomyxa filosa]